MRLRSHVPRGRVTLLVIVFALSGYVLLGLAIAARRRTMRVCLALTACVLMLFQGSMLYVAAFGFDQHIPAAPLVISAIYFLSAIAPCVVMFLKPSRDPLDPKGAYSRSKHFSATDEDLRPKV